MTPTPKTDGQLILKLRRENAKLRAALVRYGHRGHHYCEQDSWYSCPKAPEGCSNSDDGDECNCGADKQNLEVDAILARLDKDAE